MRVLFVDLKSQYDSIKGEIDQAISDVIENFAFIGEEFVKSFEQKFANYLEAKHATYEPKEKRSKGGRTS